MAVQQTSMQGCLSGPKGWALRRGGLTPFFHLGAGEATEGDLRDFPLWTGALHLR